MKKTLITLAALAMSAVAYAVNDTWILDPTVGKYTGAFSTAASEENAKQEFTMTFYMNWETAFDMAPASGSSQTFLKIYSSENPTEVISLRTSRFGASDKLYIGLELTDGENTSHRWLNQTGMDPALDTGTDGLHATLPQVDYMVKNHLGIALSLDSSGKFTFSALNTDGELASAYTMGDINDVKMDLNTTFDTIEVVNPMVSWMVVYDDAVDMTTLTDTMNKVIPEPTTATLSLLALAGLAARRRRK